MPQQGRKGLDEEHRYSLVSKLNGECTVGRQLPIPAYIGISPGEPLDEGIEIMRQRVHLSKESEPRLERLLGGLLRVEAENLIGAAGGIVHELQYLDVAVCGGQQHQHTFKVAHRAPSPPATPVPRRG